MEFKYLALGICVGYLAPYALAFIQAKRDQDSSFQSQQSEIIYHHEDNY